MVTLEGILTDGIDEQPANVNSPIVVTPSGITMSDANNEQSRNASLPILVTPEGIFILVIE